MAHKINIKNTTTEQELIGKYAFDPKTNNGGIITAVDKRGVRIYNMWYGNVPGDNVKEVIEKNGFEVYRTVDIFD